MGIIDAKLEQDVTVSQAGTYRFRCDYKMEYDGAPDSTSTFWIILYDGVTSHEALNHEIIGGSPEIVSGSIETDFSLASGTTKIYMEATGESGLGDNYMYLYWDNVSLKKVL